MRTRAALGGAIAVGLALAAPAGAATFTVNCDKRNLQNRIDNVPAGSTILVKGTCDPITIDKDLTLDGNPTATIDAGGVGRPVEISNSAAVRLVDLRITGGRVTGPTALAGGILHAGGPLTLRRVVVVGNAVEAAGSIPTALGGGIYSQGGRIRLVDSSVRGNTAEAAGSSPGAGGGGIMKTGELVLESSRVTGNRVRSESSSGNVNARAGGIGVGGDLTLERSHVDGNRATAVGTAASTSSHSHGGGLDISLAQRLSIVRSTISDNRTVASLAGGTAMAEGGGINGFSERGTIRDSVFAGNVARTTSEGGATVTARAGALYFEAPSGLSILRTRVTGSLVEATTGGMATGLGGGLSLVGGPFTIREARISSNEIDATGGSSPASARGGGVFASGSADVEIRESAVRGNRAGAAGPGGSESTGAGLQVASSNLALRASTVSGNVASAGGQALGGGIVLTGGGPHVVTNSTIAGNRASGTTARGGGIDTDTTLTLTNATLARNEAKIGGGLYVEGGTTTLRATILAANTAPDGPNCSQNVASAGHNLIANTSGCGFAHQTSDRRDLPAKLGLLGGNGGPTQTIVPRKGSPALNWIPEAQCAFPRDQRGVKRPQGARCDIGAVERRRGAQP